MTEAAPPQAPSAKSCGACTECCRLVAVPELYKGADTPCPQCNVGVGCTIYPQRPQSCRDFGCGWLSAAYMGPELRPDRCHVVFMQPDRDTILACCDVATPEAWRAPPVLAMLHLLAKNFADRIVLVRVENRMWRVLEDKILPITS
ncbi:MAG TPA: hypothetical protein VKW08_15305 [Xanthobacteraceae bacterium]|nr:hypothetical protein [Xanthobacteraceae bacterium]